MPAAPHLISGLQEIADAYEVLLCDVWGVLHNGVEGFSPAVEALEAFRDRGGATVLISNSPRPAADVVEQLRSLGVPDRAWSAFVTSGDVTLSLLRRRAGARVLKIGPERDAPLYAGLDLVDADVESADFISCTGPFHDDRETPEDYRRLFTRAAARGIPMICANPDKVVQRGAHLIYCAGALADLYKELGGAVEIAGKPHAAIYAEALKAARDQRGGVLDPSRVLAVGDGIRTDVAGANQAGLDCLFIAAGIHAEALGGGDRLDEEVLSGLLAGAGAHARYALAELRW